MAKKEIEVEVKVPGKRKYKYTYEVDGEEAQFIYNPDLSKYKQMNLPVILESILTINPWKLDGQEKD